MEIKNATRLDLIVVTLIVFTMYNTNSMDACSRWLEDPQIKRIFGFRNADRPKRPRGRPRKNPVQ